MGLFGSQLIVVLGVLQNFPAPLRRPLLYILGPCQMRTILLVRLWPTHVMMDMSLQTQRQVLWWYLLVLHNILVPDSIKKNRTVTCQEMSSGGGLEWSNPSGVPSSCWSMYFVYLSLLKASYFSCQLYWSYQWKKWCWNCWLGWQFKLANNLDCQMLNFRERVLG